MPKDKSKDKSFTVGLNEETFKSLDPSRPEALHLFAEMLANSIRQKEAEKKARTVEAPKAVQ